MAELASSIEDATGRGEKKGTRAHEMSSKVPLVDVWISAFLFCELNRRHVAILVNLAWAPSEDASCRRCSRFGSCLAVHHEPRWPSPSRATASTRSWPTPSPSMVVAASQPVPPVLVHHGSRRQALIFGGHGLGMIYREAGGASSPIIKKLGFVHPRYLYIGNELLGTVGVDLRSINAWVALGCVNLHLFHPVLEQGKSIGKNKGAIPVERKCMHTFGTMEPAKSFLEE